MHMYTYDDKSTCTDNSITLTAGINWCTGGSVTSCISCNNEFHEHNYYTECLNGQIQETISNSLEYCYNGEWRLICHDDSQWNRERTKSACTQLGYSDSGGKLVSYQVRSR